MKRDLPNCLKDIHQFYLIYAVKYRQVRSSSGEIGNSLDALDICVFPNVHQVLSIIAVLPVSTSAKETLFSTLRRSKAYLRPTMKEDRLNRLASLNVNRNLDSILI
nr:unnamed protein product [Callosobruchus analis]